LPAALGALVVAAGLAAPAGGGTTANVASSQQLTQGVATLVGTVTVRDLPAAGSGGVHQALPMLVPNPAAYAAAKAGATGSAETDSSAKTAKPKVKVGAKLAGGINSSNCGCTPPDMGIGVGGGFKMEQVNLAGKIWDANNTPGPQFSLSSFYQAGGHFISDPWVFFDQMSNRWFAGIFDVTTASQRLAVSKTTNPTGAWNIYNVPEGPPGGCPDQGKLGVSDAVVALSANEFSSCFGAPLFLGPIITVLNKAELLAGTNPVHSAAIGPLSQYSSSVVPAQSMNSTADQWYAGTDDSTSAVAHIIKTTGVPPAAVTLSEPFTPSIRTLNSPPNGVQPGTGSQVNTGDNRVQTVAWQSNSLVWTNGAACIPKKDNQTRSCSRLLAVNTLTGAVTIDADSAKKSEYYFYPAVRPNAAGTLVIGFGRSSSSVFPELDATAATPTGVFAKKPVVVQAGTVANTTGRYGDYFGVAIDPAAPSNAWVAGEIGAPGWGTAIGQVLVTP
jgi:hypothetical protein